MTSTIVIMAAGRGTRMQHLTQNQPKHLLPVLGRPFLDYTLDRVRAAGFTNIIIVVGHQAEAFDRYRGQPDIRIVPQDIDHGRYGTGAVVACVREHVSGPFACIAGDNLYSVADLQKATVETTSMWLGGFRTAAWRGMGILKQNEAGYLDRIIEKPATFVGDLINASLYLFTPKIFSTVEHLQPSVRGEYEITDAINEIAATEPVNIFELEERWYDLTTPDDIGKIERALQLARQ